MANTLVTPAQPSVPKDYAQPKHRAANGGAAATDYILHPKAQEAAALYSEALRELDNHREIVHAMQHKIDVQEETIRELQYAVDHERSMKERFQRYCVTVQTLIRSISLAAAQADEAASAQAVTEEPKKVEPPKHASKVESEVEDAIRNLKAATS
jgi:hypothetical protein